MFHDKDRRGPAHITTSEPKVVPISEADTLLFERINAIERTLDYWMQTGAVPIPFTDQRLSRMYGEIEPPDNITDKAR